MIPEAARILHAGFEDEAPEAFDWPEPIPFSDRRIPALPSEVLPGFLGGMVRAVARATETPVELPALLGLAVTAASVAGKVIVRPEPGYLEPVNIYVAPTMESGNRKTAVLNLMAEPFRQWELAEARRIKPDILRLASERKTMEARIESLRKKAATVADAAMLMAEIAELEARLPEPLRPFRQWVQDVTPEQLPVVMAQNNERIALLSDEGGIFDTLAGRYSGGVPNLDLFLQAHTGTPVRVDRGSRPPVILRRPTLTVGISPQPDVLEKLSNKPEFRGRGLLARFLYALPPSPIGFRKLQSAPCPTAVAEEYQAGIERLLQLSPRVSDGDSWEPWCLTFSPEAYEAWKTFQQATEVLMREGGKLYHIKDWGAKLAGAAARIAGILHCVVSDPSKAALIEPETMEAGLTVATVLMDHTVAAFTLMKRDKAVEDAKKVLAWIRKQSDPSFTLRDCFCTHQSRFETVDAIRPSLHLLEQHGYIRRAPAQKVSHRPSEVFYVNPRVWTMAS